jgi:hypothetical protein
LINGYRVTQAIHVAATLGIADLLADGPRTSDELADAAEADPQALYRLLRALASVGVFEEHEGRVFSSTALGEPLRSDAAEPLGGWAAFVGRPDHWAAWGDLLHSVRTGENAFRHVHGQDVWAYRSAHPEEGAIFDRAMTDLSRSSNRALLGAYDFGRFTTIVDVGGGNGALLAAILAEHRAARGVLFDQPHVVGGADAVLADAGVAERCGVVGGSFFDAVPEGGDVYLLKSVLHNWRDDEALAILLACRRAAAEGATLLVVERPLGRPNEGAAAKFMDLNMLVSAGGLERTVEEYAALFEQAGFGFLHETPVGDDLSVLEAVAG